jgi:histone-lysine N-methyltransferase SETD2
LKTVDVNLKAQIRDQPHQIAFSETTPLTPPVVSAKQKGARIDSFTTRYLSYWENVDVRYPDSQASQTKPSVSKQKGVHFGNLTHTLKPQNEILHIDQMPLFMHPYIDDIVDVVGDGYCGYRVVALDHGKSEDDFELIKLFMLSELNLNRDYYLKIYGSERRFNYIKDALNPPNRKLSYGVAPMEKWFTFPDMGHIIASHYNKVVVELTKHANGISETFFPLRGSPPSDPSSRIMCLGLIPNHFVYVKLKHGCPLPPTCLEWRQNRSEEAAEWEYSFLDRQSKFVELMNVERGQKKSNEDNPIEL